jgi:hypothetical protein
VDACGFLIVILYAVLFDQQLFNAENCVVLLCVWFLFSFAFALLTTLVPQLRCFGNGYLYGYNGYFSCGTCFFH